MNNEKLKLKIRESETHNSQPETPDEEICRRFLALLQMEREAIIKFDSSTLEKLAEEKRVLTEELVGWVGEHRQPYGDEKLKLKIRESATRNSQLATQIKEIMDLNDLNRRLLYSSVNLISSILSAFSKEKSKDLLYRGDGRLRKGMIPIYVNRRA